MAKDINKILEWFLANSNANWDPVHDFKIQTLDNPGWLLECNLHNTKLDGSELDHVRVELDENDWWGVKTFQNRIVASCDIEKLSLLLIKVLGFLEEGIVEGTSAAITDDNKELKAISRWFLSNCDGDWEHEHQIKIEVLSDLGWHITCDLEYTELENVEIAPFNLNRGIDDWYSIDIDKEKIQFIGKGDSGKLLFLLQKLTELIENQKL